MHELGELSLGHSILERHGGSEYRLTASRCPVCGDVRVPPHAVCANDLTTCERVALTGDGAVYEAVHVKIPPQGFDSPFWAGYIDLDEGPRLFAQIAWSDGDPPPSHGDRVQMTVQPIGSAKHQVLAPVFKKVAN
jgi:uncharacterized OB-fold protein